MNDIYSKKNDEMNSSDEPTYMQEKNAPCLTFCDTDRKISLSAYDTFEEISECVEMENFPTSDIEMMLDKESVTIS